jgi:hypothetical protein
MMKRALLNKILTQDAWPYLYQSTTCKNARIIRLAGFLDVEFQQAREKHLEAQAERLVWNMSIRHRSLYY